MGPAHTSFFGPLFGGIAYYLSTLHLKPTYTSQSDLGSLFMGGGVDNGVGETYYCSEHSSVPIYMILPSGNDPAACYIYDPPYHWYKNLPQDTTLRASIHYTVARAYSI
jgi:hypothetical protein